MEKKYKVIQVCLNEEDYRKLMEIRVHVTQMYRSTTLFPASSTVRSLIEKEHRALLNGQIPETVSDSAYPQDEVV